jgi:hypothetical protein
MMDIYLSITQKAIISLDRLVAQLEKDEEFKSLKRAAGILHTQAGQLATVIEETKELQANLREETNILKATISAQETRIQKLQQQDADKKFFYDVECKKNARLQQQISELQAQEASVASSLKIEVRDKEISNLDLHRQVELLQAHRTSTMTSLDVERKTVSKLQQTMVEMKGEIEAVKANITTPPLSFQHLKQAVEHIEGHMDKALGQSHKRIEQAVIQASSISMHIQAATNTVSAKYTQEFKSFDQTR